MLCVPRLWPAYVAVFGSAAGVVVTAGLGVVIVPIGDAVPAYLAVTSLSPDLSRPVAMIVMLISSPMLSLSTVPKMMLTPSPACSVRYVTAS